MTGEGVPERRDSPPREASSGESKPPAFSSSFPAPVPADESVMTTRSKDSGPTPSWFTPGRLLVIFCVINLLNYVDRGVIASNGVNGSQRKCDDKGVCTPGSGIQGEFNLNNFQDGLLSSAFMVGLLVASPIFAASAKSVNPFRLIGVGLTVWTIAAAGCGFSFNFWMIAVCRMLVGVGEASFISLAAPFIDDNAPAARKSFWLGLFYMCIPSGVALGYVYGGYVGNHLNWRWAFYIEAIPMFFFAILSFCIKPLQLKGFAPVSSKKASTSIETVAPTAEEEVENEISQSRGSSRRRNPIVQFVLDLKVLCLEIVFVVNVLGYITYNFVIGAYSYWGPKAGYDIYQMQSADMVFGGLTIVCGIVGTLAGSYVLDKMSATLSNTFKLLAASTFLGAAFCFAAFCMKSMYAFIALFAVGEILIFAPQAPVNFVCLHCVRPSLRPLSMAMSTVSIHVFGDVPSSPIVGVIQDRIHNWRKTTLILTSILFLPAIIWFTGVFLKSVDRSNEESEDDADVTTQPTLHSV
ncbi:PREDICTED: probable sphingolipid transporter spinster homolog 1 [Tarenaya hassleriana]|uniref:probable sphingolipid transporter spinster homolog 1 n=1 Tax=Tarenaya hassleriana TaxID=28532 RepID=UPI00053C3FED|nr:PREDICTED: probable sphingolipid transporter spinster homolog 1 [Tarenaya hassleriana]